MNLEADILQARILIVDDQLSNVRLLTRLLEDAGYQQISNTQDPTQVAALHASQPYDVILLDLQMPALDGFAVMQALKDGGTDRYLPVIVLTAQPGHKLRALQAGAKDFISKPFDLAEVKTRIHNMLEVRLLYRRLEALNAGLEQTVRERTAELRLSEARYRSLTELASDWYWEQDEHGAFTTVSGPVVEMLGLQALTPSKLPSAAVVAAGDEGWDPVERKALQALIAERKPFIDFIFHRSNAAGVRRQYRVSGQPMFDEGITFRGYRGIGIEMTAAR